MAAQHAARAGDIAQDGMSVSMTKLRIIGDDVDCTVIAMTAPVFKKDLWQKRRRKQVPVGSSYRRAALDAIGFSRFREPAF
jgi:hypothetical protein